MGEQDVCRDCPWLTVVSLTVQSCTSFSTLSDSTTSRPDPTEIAGSPLTSEMSDREWSTTLESTAPHRSVLSELATITGVMHYGAYAFAVDRNRPTIRALRSGGSNMGNRSRLSAMDIERVQVHYGCKNARDTEHFQHLAEVPEFNMVPED